MNVSCPECRSVFRVDPAKITSVSLRARCSVCGGLIAVGAAVQWGDDLPTPPRRTPAVGPMASTPVGVRPVLARTGVAPVRGGGNAPTAQPSVAATVAPRETRIRPTPWTPPPAFVPAPTVAPAMPPVSQEASRLSQTDRVADLAGAPSAERTITAPPEAAVSGKTQVSPPVPDPLAGVRPAPFTPARVATAGLTPAETGPASGKPPVSPAFSTPASAPPRAFGSPLTPAVATSAQPAADVAPLSSPSVVQPPPSRDDAAVAFSTRSTPAAPVASQSGQRRPINPFLANDPNQKARRLARALVSDMVAYHPTRREEGLQQGTLKQLFRDEIKKSYEEYVEQVGREFAESTTHFQDALNEVLAGGRRIF